MEFDILNSGKVRVSVVATDLVTGERVVFDMGRGARIGPDHILASCALLPLFAPMEIEWRLLGDGGMSSNAPLDVVLEEAGCGEMLRLVVDLIASEGSRPHSFSAALSRAGDLAFGNQSRRLLEGQEREHRLRAMIGRIGTRLPRGLRDNPEIASIMAEGRAHPATVLYLSYRAALDEAGPAKVFDFSRATFADRWQKRERECEMRWACLQHGIPRPKSQALRLRKEGRVVKHRSFRQGAPEAKDSLEKLGLKPKGGESEGNFKKAIRQSARRRVRRERRTVCGPAAGCALPLRR